MYHYTECGLDNVWLTNGYRTVETPYGPATSVEDMDGLHRAIALSLTEKKGQIDGQELRFLQPDAETDPAPTGETAGQYRANRQPLGAGPGHCPHR